MSGIVVNGDKMQIRQFKNIVWNKMTEIEKLPECLKKFQGVQENINLNSCWYSGSCKDYVLFAFLGNIGKDKHPLIDCPCLCAWYNSDSGGVYVVGMDKKNGALFAPLKD